MDKYISKIKNDKILKQLSPIIKEYDAYLVGGYVRDLFLGVSTNDYDIIVKNSNAKNVAKELAEKLDAYYVLLDEKENIHRVVLSDKINYIDIVNPINHSIDDDLARRDFTINAIAFSFKNYKFLDPYSGIEDIKNEKIREISEKNFIDDPLRLLRAFRFQSILGFELSEKLKKIINKHANLIVKPSKERINLELTKLFGGKNAYAALRDCDNFGLLEIILPCIIDIKKVPPNLHHHLNLFEHSLEVVRQIQILYENSDENVQSMLTNNKIGAYTKISLLKLAGFLHDIGKPSTWVIEPDTNRHRFIRHDEVGADLVKPLLKNLKYSNKQITYLAKMIKYHIYPSSLVRELEYTEKAQMRFFRKIDTDVVDLIILAKADRLSARGIEITDDIVENNLNALTNLQKKYFEIIETLKPLPKLIDGKEIMQLLGINQSPKLGEIIKKLQEEQMQNSIKTKEEAIKFVMQYKNK